MKINSEEEYQLALEKLEEIFDFPMGTSEGDEALRLVLMIEEWESKYYPI